jgi:aminoglycoside 6'-N-acetyltransferase
MYRFQSASLSDLPLIQCWQQTPAVRTWWVEADGQTLASIDESDFTNPNIAMWIVHYLDRPFAFIQDYDPHAWPDHPFGNLPLGSRGIDQFIGVPDMLNRGHGSAFIRQHSNELMAAGAPAIGTDPHPSNVRAIRAYEKAGFIRGRECVSEWGKCVLMLRHNSACS